MKNYELSKQGNKSASSQQLFHRPLPMIQWIVRLVGPPHDDFIVELMTF